jgi:hypothetical protein
MLSTPNVLPSAWFNRGHSAVATSASSMDPYQYPNSSFDQSSLQLDKSQMTQVQTQSLPPAAFGLTTKPAQSHGPQNNPGTTTTNTGLFNSSGITKSVSYSLLISIILFLWPPCRSGLRKYSGDGTNTSFLRRVTRQTAKGSVGAINFSIASLYQLSILFPQSFHENRSLLSSLCILRRVDEQFLFKLRLVRDRIVWTGFLLAGGTTYPLRPRHPGSIRNVINLSNVQPFCRHRIIMRMADKRIQSIKRTDGLARKSPSHILCCLLPPFAPA